MNIMEENFPPVPDVSAARKRRRQKRLRPLKTPEDRHLGDVLQSIKSPTSPVWTLSPAGSSNLLVEPATAEEDNISSISQTPRVHDELLQQPADGDIVVTEYIGGIGETHQNKAIIETTASNEMLSPPEATKASKKKEKRKKSKDRSKIEEQDITSNATTISAALNDFIESVDVIDDRPAPLSKRGSELPLACDGRVFVQQSRLQNFTAVSRDKAFCQTSLPRDTSASQHSSTTALSMAIDYQKLFLPFSSMCHGLLAGVAVWQCVTVFLQNGKDDTSTFIENYSNVARIFQAMFYVLSTVACVAVLDRCVPSHFSWHALWDLLILQPCCLLALTAGCGALLSSSIAAKLDDRLALHAFNETLWTDTVESDEYMSEWLTTNLVRCVLAVASYLIVSICWGDNSSALPFPEVATSVKPSSLQ